MEVKDPKQTILTNSEVYRLLQERRKEQESQPKHQRIQVLGTVIYETCKYLEKSPAATQKHEDLVRLIRETAPFGLTPAEIVLVSNLRTTNAVDIQLIIEECEERLSEEQIEALISVIKRVLPEPPSTYSERESNAQ